MNKLTQEECALLYNTVVELKPSVCLEMGMGDGTKQIAQALRDNDKGLLYTYDINKDAYNETLQVLKENNLLFRIRPYCFDFVKQFQTTLLRKIDFVFLDGNKDPDYTSNCLTYFTDLMPSGSCMILHDWKMNKCSVVREMLSHPDCVWTITDTVDSEFGMCKIIKR